MPVIGEFSIASVIVRIVAGSTPARPPATVIRSPLATAPDIRPKASALIVVAVVASTGAPRRARCPAVTVASSRSPGARNPSQSRRSVDGDARIFATITAGSSEFVNGRNAKATATKSGPSGSRTASAMRQRRRRSRGARRPASTVDGPGCPTRAVPEAVSRACRWSRWRTCRWCAVESMGGPFSCGSPASGRRPGRTSASAPVRAPGQHGAGAAQPARRTCGSTRIRGWC